MVETKEPSNQTQKIAQTLNLKPKLEATEFKLFGDFAFCSLQATFKLEKQESLTFNRLVFKLNCTERPYDVHKTVGNSSEFI